MSPSPIEVIELHKDYHTKQGTIPAVRGISFRVSESECLGLLGPNGAGKTTTMNCLTGFLWPSSGIIRILGHAVAETPREARRNLGVCSQEDTLDTDFTVLNQLVQYGTYFGLGRREARTRAIALLKRMGLEDRANWLVEALSGGMRRRLQVARALINQPRVLILDEPSTGLDPEVRRDLWKIIGEYKQSGAAILLSTHYMDEAQRLCDRVALMSKGAILDCDTPEMLIKRHCGVGSLEEEVRPGVMWHRPANLEDVYLKVTGGEQL